MVLQRSNLGNVEYIVFKFSDLILSHKKVICVYPIFAFSLSVELGYEILVSH